MLGDLDFACGSETAGRGAGWLHQGFPVAAGGFVLVVSIAADKFGCFRGADSLGFVPIALRSARSERMAASRAGSFSPGW